MIGFTAPTEAGSYVPSMIASMSAGDRLSSAALTNAIGAVLVGSLPSPGSHK